MGGGRQGRGRQGGMQGLGRWRAGGAGGRRPAATQLEMEKDMAVAACLGHLSPQKQAAPAWRKLLLTIKASEEEGSCGGRRTLLSYNKNTSKCPCLPCSLYILYTYIPKNSLSMEKKKEYSLY